MAEMNEGALNSETPEVTDPETDAAEVEADVETDAETETGQPDPIDQEAEDDDPGEEEAADVPEGKRARDSAFAEMRRAREAAESQNEELQARIEELERAQRQSELIKAATDMGLSDDEIQQVLDEAEEAEEKEREKAGLEKENERLSKELLDFQVQQAMEKDLRDIQEIDPEIKSLDDLGEDFFKFRAAMDGIDAYFAMKAKQERTGIKAPTIGKVNQASVPRDYYTSEELDTMSDEEILANWDKVQRSMDRLAKE